MDDKRDYLKELCKEFELFIGSEASEIEDEMAKITDVTVNRKDLADNLGKVYEKKIA